MAIEEINSENADKYETLIEADMLENISRIYYRGVGLMDQDGTPEASLIWELLHYDDEDRETESSLKQISATESQAKSLLEEYKKVVTSEEVGKTTFELPYDKKQDAIFAEKGFSTKQGESRMVKVSVADIAGLSIAKKTKTPSYIRDLTELDPRSFKRGMLNCLFYGRREATEDLNMLPMDWFEKDVSCYTETDGRIDGLLLVHRTASGKLRIELLINVGPEAKKDLAYIPGNTRYQLPVRPETSVRTTGYKA